LIQATLRIKLSEDVNFSPAEKFTQLPTKFPRRTAGNQAILSPDAFENFILRVVIRYF